MSTIQKPVILLADDNKDTREFLIDALGADKYDFLQASNGAEAWQMLKDNTVSLAIIDEVMPKMAGSKVVGLARSNGISIPVLIITGLRANEIAVEMNNTPTNCLMILEKPFKPQQLVDIVRSLMSQLAHAA
ncbi:MAG: response regulator [Oligoflexales bacterium]